VESVDVNPVPVPQQRSIDIEKISPLLVPAESLGEVDARLRRSAHTYRL